MVPRFWGFFFGQVGGQKEKEGKGVGKAGLCWSVWPGLTISNPTNCNYYLSHTVRFTTSYNKGEKLREYHH